MQHRKLGIEQLERRDLLSWGILTYVCGDNNLSSSYKYIVQTQLKNLAARNPNLTIAAELDLAGKGGGARYIYEETSVKRTAIPEPNMGATTTLTDFLTWERTALANVDHVAMIFADHGSGWMGLCRDDTSKDRLTLPEVKDAFEQVDFQADVLFFDACSMQQIEVLYQIRGHADYVVAHEGLAWVTSYSSMLNGITAESTSLDFAKAITDGYAKQNARKGYTVSVVDMAQATTLFDSLDNLASAIQTSTARSEIRTAFNQAAISGHDWPDVGALTNRLSRVADDLVHARAQEVNTALTSAVVFEKHRAGLNRTGISIENPYHGITATYRTTDWAIETLWDQIV